VCSALFLLEIFDEEIITFFYLFELPFGVNLASLIILFLKAGGYLFFADE
jgi:hypothetical protein